MADVTLKTIKFPGLSNTYTIPQVDPTLKIPGAIADAKVTGDAISSLNGSLGQSMDGFISSAFRLATEENYDIVGGFESGTINSSGNKASSTKSVRSIHPILVDKTIKVGVSPTDNTVYKFAPVWYDSGFNFISRETQRANGYEYTPPSNARFVMFYVSRQDGADITANESTFISVYCEKPESMVWKILSRILHGADNDKNFRGQAGITSFSAGAFEQGRFLSNSATKERGEGSANYIRTTNPIALNHGYVLTATPTEGYRCFLTFVDKYGVFVKQSNAFSERTEFTVLNSWRYAYATIYKSPLSAISPSETNVFLTYEQASPEVLISNHETRIGALEEGTEVVPSYFETQLETKIPNIIHNANSVGKHGETFIFITDPHWDKSYRNSPALIRHILNKTNVNLILCGGDMIDGGAINTMYPMLIDCVRHFQFPLADNFLPIAFGNHDDNYIYSVSTSDNSQIMSKDAVYSCMYAQIADKVTFMTDNEFSFYFDRITSKTRFIFLDTGEDSTFTAFDELANVLNSTPNGYNIIFVAHFIYGGGYLRTSFRQVMDVIAAYNSRTYVKVFKTYNFTEAVGKVQLILGGHTHSDMSWEVGAEGNTAGVPIIITDTDSYRDHSGTEGTVNSQCFDVISVDYTGKTVKCTRIGRGNDRTLILA